MLEKAQSMEEYVAILNEILDELDELRFAIEYDEEFMEGSIGLIRPLEEGVKLLLAAIEDGSYQFGQGDYSFFDLAKNANPLLLPFKHLVSRAEVTHFQGLAED